MSETNTTEILNRLAGTYLAVEALNTAIPELQKGFRENRRMIEELQRLSSAAEKSIKEAENQGEQFNEEAKKAINQIVGAVRRFEDIQESIVHTVTAFPDAEELQEELKDLSERITTLERWIAVLGSQYDQKMEEIEEKLQMILEGGLPVVENGSGREDLAPSISEERNSGSTSSKTREKASGLTQRDYDEDALYSIEELLAIVDMEELLVVREKWRRDFCFLVKSINRGYALGMQYLDGEAYKEMTYNSDAEEFRLYNGPSKSKILNQQ